MKKLAIGVLVFASAFFVADASAAPCSSNGWGIDESECVAPEDLIHPWNEPEIEVDSLRGEEDVIECSIIDGCDIPVVFVDEKGEHIKIVTIRLTDEVIEDEDVEVDE